MIFGITLFILRKYVFGPVARPSRRRAEIAQSIEEAERSRDEATALLEDYKFISEARKEADALREQGRKDGEHQVQELVTAAQGQRDRVLADAKVALRGADPRGGEDLRDDVVSLALLAAEKVSRRTLSEADHRKLIEEAIEEADLSAVASSGSAPA